MATKHYPINLDGDGQSLINWRIYPLTTLARTALTPGAGAKGLISYDTDLEQLFTWDGAAWNPVVTVIAGAVTFKGASAFDAAEPGTPAVGDMYVFSTGGSNTWNAAAEVVQIGDQAIWDGTNWQFIQGNIIEASETQPGVVETATQGEVNTGTDALRYVTPATLAGYIGSSKKLGKVWFEEAVVLVADTPKTITHNLALQNKDAYVLSVKDGSGSEIEIDNDGVNANSLTITSNIAMASVNVTVIGF